MKRCENVSTKMNFTTDIHLLIADRIKELSSRPSKNRWPSNRGDEETKKQFHYFVSSPSYIPPVTFDGS